MGNLTDQSFYIKVFFDSMLFACNFSSPSESVLIGLVNKVPQWFLVE